MLRQFYMNSDLWRVRFVSPSDDVLIDRTGKRTLAVTDYSTKMISIANNLCGELLRRVFVHELGHCIMFSYGLLPELHRMVKKQYWIEVEEWVCDFLANHSHFVIRITRDILGNQLTCIAPIGAERMIT